MKRCIIEYRYEVSGFRGFEVSGFRGFGVPGFRGFGVGYGVGGNG